MTVTVAGGVVGRLVGRLTCVLSGAAGCVVAGVWATVDAVGAAVWAQAAMAKHTTALPPIVKVRNRWKNIFMVLLKTAITSFGYWG